ncbi:MAG: acyltransferase [Desulfobacterales bacterium]|nr:acyltransferase [Desulfobacterales bacterium]
MKIKCVISNLFDVLFDLLLLNGVTKLYLMVKGRYISPRIDKVRGLIAVDRIKHKGIDLRIHGQVYISAINNLVIGDYVRIGKGAYLSCEGGLSIGDNSQLSRNVLIYTSSHDIHSSAIPYDKKYVYKPVLIGNSVWIGMNVTITPGTVIGDGAVIGMGTVVSGEVPKGAIVVGAKQRIIDYRDMDDFHTKKLNQKYFGLLFPES